MYSLCTDIPGEHPSVECKLENMLEFIPCLLRIYDQMQVVTTQNHKPHAQMLVAAREHPCMFGQKGFVWRDDTFNTMACKSTLYWFPYYPFSTVTACACVCPRVMCKHDSVQVQNVSLPCI